MKRARDYRRDARETLGHDIFGPKWMYALLIILVDGLLVGALSAIGAGILGILISGPLSYGLIAVFLRITRNEDEKANIEHLFDGFKEKFGESFVTSLLVFIFTFLWSLLLIIPGIIKSYAYSASMYLVRERNLEGTDAITESRKLMNGNKWRLFCLDLSFIGWYILGMICFGVGVLWVETYHTAARTHFFEDILNNQNVVDVK